MSGWFDDEEEEPLAQTPIERFAAGAVAALIIISALVLAAVIAGWA